MGFVHRRRRGAELFLLVLALAVGIGAYAAVGIGVEGEVPRRHHRLRRLAGRPGDRAPTSWSASWRRTPTRCCSRSSPPSTASASRSSTGSTWPTRTTRSSRTASPHKQLTWMTLGVVLFVAHAGAAARPPRADPVHLHLRARRDRAAPAADGSRASARPSTAPGSGSTSARSASSPARSPRCCWSSRSPATSCCTATRSRWPAGGWLFIDLPRGRDLGPILVMWLISLGILVFQKDLGSSLLFFGLFLVMLYVATERPGWLVVGALLFFGGAALALPAVRPRPEPGQHLARPDALLRPVAPAAARSSSRCSAWPGAG